MCGTDPMTPWAMLWTTWLPRAAFDVALVHNQQNFLDKQICQVPSLWGRGDVKTVQSAKKNGNATSTTV